MIPCARLAWKYTWHLDAWGLFEWKKNARRMQILDRVRMPSRLDYLDN